MVFLMDKSDLIDHVIEKRYKPGLREFKNKLKIDDINLKEIKETINENFDNYLFPIYNGILNTIYAKEYDEKLKEIMEKYSVDKKIVLGRDCNLFSGYMIGCSRICFDFGYNYTELKENLKLIDYVINRGLIDCRSDFRKLKKEIYENFDIDEPVIICDTGFSNTQQVILAKYLKFKEPILVLGKSHARSCDFKSFDLEIECSFLESPYHPIDPYKEINKINKKINLSNKEKENIYLYCLTTEEMLKNKSIDKALDKIFCHYTKGIFGDKDDDIK